jgi:hypothetical protein
MATSLALEVESSLQEDALDRLIERAGVGVAVHERAHRLVHRVASFFGRPGKDCVIDWQGVPYELLPVLSNADGVVSRRRFRAIMISRRFATRRRSGVSGDE